MKPFKTRNLTTGADRVSLLRAASLQGKRGARAVLRAGVSVSEFEALLKGRSATPGTVRSVYKALGMDHPKGIDCQELREPNRSRRERVAHA